MKARFIAKNALIGPTDDWILLTDFCGRRVYFQPHEAQDVVDAIWEAVRAGIVQRPLSESEKVATIKHRGKFA